MTTRIHGGDIREAIRRYDLREKDVIDFSSSVNPLGPSPAAVRAAGRTLSRLDRYPDSSAAELRRAVARYFGIQPGQVICGNGSNGLIHLIPRAFRPGKVLIPVPSYSEYAAAVEEAGGEVVPLVLKEQDGFRLDPLDVSFALAGMDMAMIGNPDNPTGRLAAKDEMLEIARYARREDVRLMVDEAFMDFDDSHSLVKEAVQTPHLICLRAFTKFFGLAGLRVGYAVAHEEIIEGLQAAQEPWTVSTPAEAAAVAALGDWGFIRKTRALIEKERERLMEELRVLPGVEPFPASANFVLIRLASLDAPTLTEKLALRGFLVRDCTSFAGLDSRYIRIAVRTRRENKRLIRALREILIR